MSDNDAAPATWPIVGHEWAVELLRAGLAAQRLSHALLFTGPTQIGKTTLARAVAAALNCQSEQRPCGQCRSCRLVARDSHPDVRLVQAQAGKGGRDAILKIDQIRELQREAALAPMEGRFKVFLLRELERANPPAANALLKTLEEPPSQVILLLTSARPHALLPTIVSRCQVLALRPLPIDQIRTALVERWQADPETAALLARLSAGRLGWAVQRLTDSESWEERKQRLADLQELVQESLVRRLAYAEGLSRSPEAILPVLALWTTWWRDLLLVQMGCADAISNIDLAAELTVQADRFAPAAVRGYLTRLQTAQTQVGQNVNLRLLAETLLMRMPVPVLQA